MPNVGQFNAAPVRVIPAGPESSANVSVSPASGSIAVSVRLNGVPTGRITLSCVASCGGWLVCTTVTWNVIVAVWPAVSVTLAVKVLVPSWAAVGDQSISGGGLSAAPVGDAISA